ncbi:DUF4956 domain-containing protein [Marinimicrobium locisalis]|uniref:DUF4956 domain-containing protein n=1 Tax=Marinimicrobium locisalis TaxID=546022 RepID=UPI003221E65D
MFTLDFVFRYVILLAAILILLRGIYFRRSPDRESLFSFFLFSNGVFLITYLVHDVDLSMGFAFGLFAVFAMLRYRTEPISIRDMTYLFVTIGMALMCSLAPVGYGELATIMALLCVLSGVGETKIIAPRVVQKTVVYDNIQNINQENNHKLIDDLTARTGLNIVRVEVGKIDYLCDSAQLKVYCRESAGFKKP